MTKPIFVVGIPSYRVETEMMDSIQKNLDKKMKGYYVIVYSTNMDEIEFKCFYEKDFNEVKFEELKQIVKNTNKLETGLSNIYQGIRKRISF